VAQPPFSSKAAPSAAAALNGSKNILNAGNFHGHPTFDVIVPESGNPQNEISIIRWRQHIVWSQEWLERSGHKVQVNPQKVIGVARS
jgi:hypothetical protein